MVYGSFSARDLHAASAVIGTLSRLDQMQATIKRYNLLIAAEAMPQSICQCKKILEARLFVNIYDYLAGNAVNFPNRVALRNYCKKHKKFFPVKLAKECYEHKILLRVLL